MARNEWTRWGRGSAEGYSLRIGGTYARFHADVVKGGMENDGSFAWHARINMQTRGIYDTCEDAMAACEFELSIDGEDFVASYLGFRAHRAENKFSKALPDHFAQARQWASADTKVR